jgi:cytidine deaminase
VAFVDDTALLEEARKAAAFAYAPYSGFSVGAAVLTAEGRVFHGANVENASYGLTLCAERSALARAAGEGIRPGDVVAVAATAAPCGACRQWISEFRAARVVYEHQGEVLVRTPAELLPDSFEL